MHSGGVFKEYVLSQPLHSEVMLEIKDLAVERGVDLSWYLAGSARDTRRRCLGRGKGGSGWDGQGWAGEVESGVTEVADDFP